MPLQNDPPPEAGAAGSILSTKRGGASSRTWIVAAVTYGVFLAALFAKPLASLALYALGSDLNSHIVLVPIISAYLIAIQRSQLPRRDKPAYTSAFLSTLPAFGAFYIRWTVSAISENDGLSLVVFSFLCLLTAGGFVFLGKRWMMAAAFPVAFLLFMIPLPDAAVSWLENASKVGSAESSALLFGIFGTPVMREGLVFRLPGIVIEVAQECSGIRSSWVLFITSLLASHLFLKSPWHRVLLVAFVIPLGLLRNGFRIAVIAWLCIRYGPQMIDSIVHRRGGPLFFVLSLVPLFLLLVLLRTLEKRRTLRRRGEATVVNI